MAKVLDELCRDHRNMAHLFDLLGRELNTFKEGGLPDYELVGKILDYCLNYPDLYHHPREDLIFDWLQARDGDTANVIGNLRGEHGRLTALTRRFAAAVKNVLEDETLPRDWFLDVANDFLSFSRNHMQMEEVLFYPAARKLLTEDDWNELAKLAKDIIDDPLFGEEPHEKFDDLYAQIMAWSGGPAAKAGNG